MSSTVYIVAAQRTAIGSFQGQFAQTPATQLGATAIKAALAQAKISAGDVSECIMGQVLAAGAGQAPARQAAIYAGLPNSTICMTINKVCGSGLKAVALGADQIQLGHSSVVVAGGQENMTLSPYLLEGARAGFRMGHQQTSDSMIKDGLWDPYSNFHMATAAEFCAREYKFTREEQDLFAKESYERAQLAQKSGWFNKEIAPVSITTKGDTVTLATDEEPPKARFDKMLTLKPAFEKEGTITAANASKINDGAAALVLASEETVKAKGLKPLAKILGYGTYAQEPKWFTTAPVGAMKMAFQKTGLTAKDIDLYEINEAFSLVPMAAMRDLQIPREKVNTHGGAIALGHPIGASGARILTTLIYALEQQNKTRGLASLCIGGGEGIAMIVERV